MIDVDSALSIVLIKPETSDRQGWRPELDWPVEIQSPHDTWNHLDQVLPDAVVILDCDAAHIQFLTTLHDCCPGETRPAVILFANETPVSPLADLIDVVLPPINHPLVTHQIRQAVEQRQQLAAMQIQLEATRQELDRERALKLRSMDELEVLKNTIVRNVTHELNTPLLQVKSAVALIAEDMVNNNLVDYALQSTARLETVVKNITQLANCLDDPHISPIIIRECVEGALRDLRRTWEYKEHIARVNILIEKNLPLALGDRQGLVTILQQLMDNALKFSKDQVEVRAYLTDEHIHLSVQDYGIGIASDQLGAIFDTFFQVDSSSRRHYGGTGVGLAIVRLILERHNSQIHVESEPGTGSLFWFTLPVARLDRQA
ncbi:MAG: HAMP domain-containing histidine kinase [Anaerolineae bacterium]|nr:HAMP domain-containing histidine kinase [Anaerolineae bacterium]